MARSLNLQQLSIPQSICDIKLAILLAQNQQVKTIENKACLPISF